MPDNQLQQLFAKNRAEELGYDVWERYVLPPFFDKLNISETRKPKIIIGGRGCGKTMLLRYLSHESTFSPHRERIPSDALSHIGLYWRADTQFASMMQHRDLQDDTWHAAFCHLAAVVLASEVLRSLESIAASKCEDLNEASLRSLSFERLTPFSSEIPSEADELRVYLEDRLAEFETWTNDVRTVPQPRFLPGHAFLKRMVSLIGTQIPQLSRAVFFVYIDEYENLAPYQQRVINTWLKHSEPPLIFNLAMKRNGFKTRRTEGDESLSRIHDYRDTDLEDYDLDREFPVFAGEIILLHLRFAGLTDVPINPDMLRDPAAISSRSDLEYTRAILSTLQHLLPGISQKEMAIAALQDASVRRRLVDRIKNALKSKNTEDGGEEFVNSAYPEASIVVPALLSRDSLSVTEVRDELEQLKSGKDNRFTGSAAWIHNNFIGCYLQLYDGLPRACPFYGGFSTYCHISRGNLRHFLELCHQSMSQRYSSGGSSIGDAVPLEIQAQAARQVATDLLGEVKSFGPQGNNLHSFILRLGSLFSLSQQRPSQSEPERTHFAVQKGDSLGHQIQEFFDEAVKWSVLFEEQGTKRKSATDPEDVEYVLNPIYSPYFHISYRKKRRIELTSADATVLVRGSYDNVRQLLKQFQEKWRVDLAEASLPLFAHLVDEGADE